MSETAAASPTPQDVISAMTPEARHQWKLTGELPTDSPTDSGTPDADSSPAAPAAPVESTDSSIPPASEPGTPAKKTKLKARTEELDAEIAALNERLAQRAKLRDQLREPDPSPTRPSDASPAASSPATVTPLETLLKTPDLSKPPLDDQEFFATYPQATISQLARYQARYESLSLQQEHSAQARVQTKIDTFVDRREAAKKANPQIMAELDPRVTELAPIDILPAGVQPGPLNLVAQEIIESDQPIEIMQYLSDHRDVFDRLATMTSRDAILREMGRIQAFVGLPVSPSRVVAPKTTTSAPAPSTTLGSRPTGTIDDVAAAVTAGDFGRYKAAQNERDRKAAS